MDLNYDNDYDNTKAENVNEEKNENSINLERINTNYEKLKQQVADAEKRYEQLKEKADKLKKPYYKCQYIYESVKETGDKEKIDLAKSKLDEVKKQIQEVKLEATKEKQSIERYKKSIDIKLDVVKNNPEMAKEIDKALLKRYERQQTKLTKEKSELVVQKVKLYSFQDLISKHPSVGNNLRGVLSGIQSLNEIDEKYEDNKYLDNGATRYKDYRIKVTLDMKRKDVNAKIEKNLQLLFDFCGKNGISQAEVASYITMIGENGFIERDGQIDLDYSFNKNINRLNDQIYKYDKRINDYSTLRESIQESIKESENNEKINAENNVKNNAKGKVENIVKNNAENRTNNAVIDIEDNQIKWWQFGKRFRNWWILRREGKQRQQLPSASIENQKDTEITINNTENNIKNDLNIDNFKYNIVRDAMEKQQKADFRYLEKMRKQDEKNQDIDEEER